ncbi:MAG TPA: S-layer protein [Planctomycetaceae bacterium]|nr:S-layer protein [Planctomycetaceae bacterium]
MAVLACGLPSQSLADGLVVYPDSIRLTGKDSHAHFVVQKRSENDAIGSQIPAAELQVRIADQSVVRWNGERLVALADGETEVTIASPQNGQVVLPVKVVGSSKKRNIEFNAHVQSILSRQGCNSGACHGALAGKGGFRLSLRGYDSLADHFTITRESRGRRIEPADPGRSLLLAKPTMAIPHKGGKRLETDSDDYRLLAQWIADGYRGPQESDAELESVEVLPTDLQLKTGDTQDIIVRAHYADGRIEDVTRWAKFSSANERVATVGEDGKVKILDRGKGTVVVWYASRIATASLLVPYGEQLASSTYRDFRPKNLIDEILLDEWQNLGLAPSPTCTDETFIRRAYLDVTGTTPSPQEVLDFIASADPQRREKLVEKLLASEAYVDYWSYRWSDLLLVNGTLLRPDAVAAFYNWIREQVEENTPWDEFAQQIVLARGESLEQGATNFYAIHQTPEDLTENTCQAFMGLSIGCAKCHNHPLEKWTNDQYYAMANLYARVRAKGWGGDSRNGDGKRTLVVLQRGDIIQPSTGKPQAPAPLDQPPIDIDSTLDRRSTLAQWLTSDDNTYFSRSIVNRVWANFMGVGLVESVDDLRVSNPASSERLIDALAQYLIENDYDLKKLMKLIMTSSVYSRSSEPTNLNRDDGRFYCRYYPRRLMAEVIHDQIVSVTGVPSSFTKIEFPGADTKDTDFYDEGTRSIELYDSAVKNYFLKTFGRHQRRITCVCERSDQPTVVQALHLNNGNTINDKLANKGSIVRKWIEDQLPIEEVIRNAYLSALSRLPTAGERARILEIVHTADANEQSRELVLEDLLWSLMTSREFLFSH